MSRLPLTAAQERAVEADLPEICVTAGAGSGKTRVLVERFVRLVLRQGVPVERILAITFTEKAASELKDRIARAFEEAGRDRERREIESACIATIDSFCARLLREHALEAGVDPRFRVLPEMEAVRLMREAADAVLLGGDEKELSALLEATGITDLSDCVRSLYEKIRHAGMPLSLATLEPRAASEDPLARLEEALREMALVAAQEPLTGRQASMVRSLSELPARLRALPEAGTVGEIAGRYGESRRLYDFKGLASRPRLASALRDLDAALWDWRARELEKRAAPFRRNLADLLVSFDEEYGRRKRALAALDFADLEQRVRDLLSGSEPTRRRIRARFTHLFLDEFQDTNPLQHDIVRLLHDGNALFVVGDAKQSIYGFRDADVSILEDLRARSSAAGGALSLPENFRSRPELVEFANRLFSSPLWQAGGVPFEPMQTACEALAKACPSVEILKLDGPDAAGARRREAAALAARLAALVEGGQLRRPASGSGEPAGALSYGDVAILFRTTTWMRTYERALSERRIPYFVQKGRGYFRTQEVRDLMNLVRVLENPRDDLALAAVLRSPLCGLTDDDLLRVSLGEGRRWRLWDRLERARDLPEDSRRRIEASRLLLEEIRGRRSAPLWRRLQSLLSRTPLALDALLHFNGRRRFANLGKLLDLVRRWETGGDAARLPLPELLEEYQSEETRESEAMVESSQDDTVRLMTIHAAKGLEFPLVALADLGRGEHLARQEGTFRRGEGFGWSFYDPASGRRSLKPAGTERLEALDKEAQQREENRLLYVGVTRAREHLILSGWSVPDEQGEGSWMKSILEALGGENALRDDPRLRFSQGDAATEGGASFVSLAGERRSALEEGEALGPGLGDSGEGALSREILRRTGLSSPPADATPFVTTASEIVQHSLCPRRYHLRYRLGAPQGSRRRNAGEASEASEAEELAALADDAVLKDDEVPAEVLGDRVHRILASEGNGAALEDLLSALGPRDREEARRQVETFRRSPLGRRAAAGEAQKEIPFAMARHGSTLRGQIDLVLRAPDGEITLVDYKTSRIRSAEVAEKAADYGLQLRIYALAAAELFGRLPVRACLYFLHPDVVFDVPIGEAELLEAERAIADFFSAQQREAFPESPARHCFACGYRQLYCPGVTDRIPRAAG
ncbi:MAG TPA: UvrD-helicase domain-containing protein [Candidatus Polarisedimenticolia bacterium]|nr:UvrD-helicase domain-containing protein [Candidatus Polarisedimenticolia bacterium]